ncbi:ABC transporter ATP-binding protein [Phytomonospora sp. NPDC050363]|uniref:ABC transporter ATP-binding protein n=1 Tax=Phytomonospora sp. NPDC050363 TaxID=3155642 RepID=UPI0033FC0CB3
MVRHDRTKLAGMKLSKGTMRRILRFASPYRGKIVVFLVTVVLSSAIGVATPVLAGDVINAITGGGGDASVVVRIAVIIAILAVVDGALSLVDRWFSARIGEGIIFDLRRGIFGHVQRMPLQFFTRTQTGALVSRLNNDIIGAQRAFTTTLSGVASNTIAVTLTLGVMLGQSWQITLISLVLLPVFVFPARYFGRKLAALTKESFDLNASMNARMTERFGVGGALLVKLFGNPDREAEAFGSRAGRVRDIGVTSAMYARIFFVALTVTAGLTQALTWGLGGWLAFNQSLSAGTVVTLALLLTRLYGPLTALSNVRVDVMSALVSFQRVFEILDLDPPIKDAADAVDIPRGSGRVEFRDVHFRYPSASEVSLASLEEVATLDQSRNEPVLRGVSFTVERGQLVAIVGPSGAGKTTTSMLVPRIYDVTEGAVLVGDVDVRHATAASLRAEIGVVTQDAHLFHDTIRANLAYGLDETPDESLWEALERAQIAPLVRGLPDGLDTVVGERGYRFSGGEKQRLAIARLLLRSPGVVILDEATAHLDSESEAAVQAALAEALAGRTALVIAHRLSTVRDADQIIVLAGGLIAERGTHDELVAAGGMYADLYRTQFARTDSPSRPEDPDPLTAATRPVASPVEL